MKLRALVVLIVGILVMALVTPPSALAQTSTPPIVNAAGSYTFTGANVDGSNPFTGTLAVTGSGGVYSVVYTQGSVGPVTSLALLTGYELVGVSGDPSCSITAYLRAPTGLMIGKWIDSGNGNTLGVDVLTPTAKTTSFEGNYQDFGSGGNGGFYEGTADITAGKDGVYNFKFSYPATTSYAAYSVQGYGLASNYLISAAVSGDPAISADKCNTYLVHFLEDGSYTATYVTAGTVTTAKGKRVS